MGAMVVGICQNPKDSTLEEVSPEARCNSREENGLVRGSYRRYMLAPTGRDFSSFFF